VKSWDVIIVGAGIIGLSLSLELRKRGASVLLLERGEPGREASWAAGGMLANCGDESPAALKPLADRSAAMYPDFVAEIEDASGLKVDLRANGTLLFLAADQDPDHIRGAQRLPAPLAQLEPHVSGHARPVVFLRERSVCPRALVNAVLKAARHRGVEVKHGEQVASTDLAEGRATGVKTTKTAYGAAKIVNCAGAWAGTFGPQAFPTRPVKGQMVCFALSRPKLLQHVVRSPEIYLIPRSDGRLLAGATVEEAGFDKRTVVETIQSLERAAISMLPALSDALVLEAWAGLRPGTPDGLPILGATETPGYFAATGHFRDGILLAPVTARVMAQVLCGETPQEDLRLFSPERFSSLGARGSALSPSIASVR
jgi:glycine oxidase